MTLCRPASVWKIRFKLVNQKISILVIAGESLKTGHWWSVRACEASCDHSHLNSFVGHNMCTTLLISLYNCIIKLFHKAILQLSGSRGCLNFLYSSDGKEYLQFLSKVFYNPTILCFYTEPNIWFPWQLHWWEFALLHKNTKLLLIISTSKLLRYLF